MFQVLISSKCSKEIKSFKKDGLLRHNDLQVIKAWIQEVKLFGPDYIKKSEYWNDHALRGKRAGERSSSFSECGRIIYKVSKNKITIRVLKITPNHDYK